MKMKMAFFINGFGVTLTAPILSISGLCVRGNTMNGVSRVFPGITIFNVSKVFPGLTVSSVSYVYVFLLFWKQRVLQLFPKMSPKVYLYIYLFCSLIFLRIFYSLGYLLMDELHQAVAPFLHASGRGRVSSGMKTREKG